MVELDITNVLNRCKKAANRGEKIANKEFKHLESTLISAEERINEVNFELSNKKWQISDLSEMLSSQLMEIQSSFASISSKFIDDIETIKQNKSKFSIVLFGRTKAGKSTLFETLTNGDGKSIGTGETRKTRDKRTYPWLGLEITDLPGVDAYEGEEDEQIALYYAVPADLILFIIEDDAPTKAEADFLSYLINQGKPIIIIFNVKAAFKNTPERTLKGIRREFDMNRLVALTNGFLEHALPNGQDWSHIPVVYVHLLAAFTARKTANPELAKKYEEVSRIQSFYSKLIDEVRTKGEYYKIKNFIDTVSVPLLDSVDIFLQQNQENITQADTLFNTSQELRKWSRENKSLAKQRIHACIDESAGNLRNELSLFVDDHYTDEHAGAAWEKVVEEQEIIEKCNGLLADIDEKCLNQINNTYRRLQIELTYLSPSLGSQTIKVHRIIDFKRGWDLGYKIIAGGFEIGGILASIFKAASLAKSFGAAGLAIGVIGALISAGLKKYSKKEKEAKEFLKHQLENWIDDTFASLEKQMIRKLDDIFKERIDAFLADLGDLQNTVKELANSQKNLAWELCGHAKNLNKELVSEALHILGIYSLEEKIISVARVPGNEMIILLERDTVFPSNIINKLQWLTSERIRLMCQTNKKSTLIYKVLGKTEQTKTAKILINTEKGEAYISEVSKNCEIDNKRRMAQQLTELAVLVK